MIKVGITGGIGSGKSVVCSIFKQLNIPVFDADSVAKTIMLHEDIQQKIKDTFGEIVCGIDKKISTKKLGELVFNDNNSLQKLNSIIHPEVGKVFEDWCMKQTSPYIIKEAAILFESGSNKSVDKVITVVSPLELRIARVMKRNSLSREEVLNRISKQWSDEEKIKRSDFVVKNDEVEMLLLQVMEVDRQLRV